MLISDPFQSFLGSTYSQLHLFPYIAGQNFDNLGFAGCFGRQWGGYHVVRLQLQILGQDQQLGALIVEFWRFRSAFCSLEVLLSSNSCSCNFIWSFISGRWFASGSRNGVRGLLRSDFAGCLRGKQRELRPRLSRPQCAHSFLVLETRLARLKVAFSQFDLDEFAWEPPAKLAPRARSSYVPAWQANLSSMPPVPETQTIPAQPRASSFPSRCGPVFRFLQPCGLR